MQLQGLMFMIFMLVIIPIIMLSSNHILFFVIISMVLFFASIRNLYSYLAHYEVDSHCETDEESADDLEALFELDIKKFGVGVKVAKNLIIILFLVYCVFAANYFPISVLCTLVGLYWIHEIRIIIKPENTPASIKSNAKLDNVLFFAANIGMVLVVLWTSVYMLFY